jgi:colanic acid/amylovoran biosynthesis protein
MQQPPQRRRTSETPSARHLGGDRRRLRILVDQSGYHLLNIGDVAMLMAAVARLRRCWPDAEIEVVAHAPERLATYCPDCRAVDWISDGDPTDAGIARRFRAAAVQGHKTTTPFLAARLAHVTRRFVGVKRRGLLAAVRRADVVVAAGGGYVNDTFWWHAAGVLSVLDFAHALGKPTAMFGQGIGPLTMPLLRRQATAVLPSIDLICLREGVAGPGLLKSLGVGERRVVVTGDDALELTQQDAPLGDALGVNIRVASYSKLGDRASREIAAVALRVARANAAAIVGLPVCRYPRDSDLDALARTFPVNARDGVVVRLEDLDSPRKLARAVSRCRVVLTGSYHAAVFALSQGIPCVCVDASDYYRDKFAGVAQLFPGCEVVSLTEPGFARQLERALTKAWRAANATSAAGREAANRQAQAGTDAYGRFAQIVNATYRVGAT